MTGRWLRLTVLVVTLAICALAQACESVTSITDQSFDLGPEWKEFTPNKPIVMAGFHKNEVIIDVPGTADVMPLPGEAVPKNGGKFSVDAEIVDTKGESWYFGYMGGLQRVPGADKEIVEIHLHGIPGGDHIAAIRLRSLYPLHCVALRWEYYSDIGG